MTLSETGGHWDLILLVQPFTYLFVYNNSLFLNPSYVVSITTYCYLLCFHESLGQVKQEQKPDVPQSSTRDIKNQNFVNNKLNYVVVTLTVVST